MKHLSKEVYWGIFSFKNSLTVLLNRAGCSIGIKCPESGIMTLFEALMPALILCF
jgi:hypothetical protein